jgi:acetyl esterase/lipase
VTPEPPPVWRSYPYGPHPAQVAELALPPSGPARGTVLLIHGGYWRARYDRSLQHDVAADLVAAGWAVWNLDYRAVGPGPTSGGGWPSSYQDVAAGIDALARAAADHRLDLGVLIAVGHSAGGTLALWAAGRHRLPPGAPGASPLVRPSAVIAQAAICDLVAGARQGLGAGAIVDLLGAHPAATDAAADRYALASPAALLPLGVPVLLVTGAQDDTVPVRQSVAFAAAAARAGDDVTLEIVPGEGHFGHLDPGSDSWSLARAWLDRIAQGSAGRVPRGAASTRRSGRMSG